MQYKIGIPTVLGKAPALVVEPEFGHKKTVLVYPGLGTPKEVQLKEMNWLAESGYRAVAVDAPHHGERADGYLETATGSKAHFVVMQLVQEAISEIRSIVDYCVSSFGPEIAITGISLGGYIAYGAVLADKRLQVSIPVLGSPDWKQANGKMTKKMLELSQNSPCNYPGKFPPCALLAANAGKDTSVPPIASREFLARLRSFYQTVPERIEYIEYPESEHFMREEDWIDLWRRIIGWLNRFL